MEYATTIRLNLPYDEAIRRVKDVFKGRGFGTLTEIDVTATLREKLGAEIEPYLIIGACNPRLAQRALDAEREIGVLLPCNVVVRQADGGGVTVDAFDPSIMASVPGNPELGPIAEEASRLVGEALAELAGKTGERTPVMVAAATMREREQDMNWTWSLRSRDGAMNGLEFSRCLTAGGLSRVLVHAAPAQATVEIIDDEHRLIASGDVDRDGEYSPMTELSIDNGRVGRREVWPSDDHNGLAVLLPGGEAGVLTAWRHDDDHTWWQWSVEFSNHTGRPDHWAPPNSKLRR